MRYLLNYKRRLAKVKSAIPAKGTDFFLSILNKKCITNQLIIADMKDIIEKTDRYFHNNFSLLYFLAYQHMLHNTDINKSYITLRTRML